MKIKVVFYENFVYPSIDGSYYKVPRKFLNLAEAGGCYFSPNDGEIVTMEMSPDIVTQIKSTHTQTGRSELT